MTLYPAGNKGHRTYSGDRGIKLWEAKKEAKSRFPWLRALFTEFSLERTHAPSRVRMDNIMDNIKQYH